MRGHATAFVALLAALAMDLAWGANCPGVSTTTHLRKTVLGGKRAWLTVRVKNTGTTALDDLAVALTLPDGVSFVTGKTLPKNGDIDLAMAGEDPTWSNIALGARKSRTFKVKVQYDKCAEEDSVIDVGVSQMSGATATCTTTTSAEVRAGCNGWLSSLPLGLKNIRDGQPLMSQRRSVPLVSHEYAKPPSHPVLSFLVTDPDPAPQERWQLHLSPHSSSL